MNTPLLDWLDDSRVFSLTKVENDLFEIEESCDRAFSVELTKEMLLALAKEIEFIARNP